MFHLILTACLAASPGNCAAILLPEGDAATRQACEMNAQRIAQAWLSGRPELMGGAISCKSNNSLDALDLQEVAPGLHVRIGQIAQMENSPDGRIANLAVVVGRDSVAVIDAGVSRAEGQALHVAIRRVTDLPIRYLVLTHAHPDHSLGASVPAEAGAEVLGHRDLPRALEVRGATYLDALARLYPPAEWIGTYVVLPDTTVADRMEIDLGDRVLELRAAPTGHTDSDLVVLDRKTATLFTGDLLFRDLTPVVDGSLRGWLDWMKTDPAAGAALIVPGHGQPAGTWAEASGAQQIFLEALAEETRRAIAAGLALSEAVPDIMEALAPLDKEWAVFGPTVARDATAAFKELEWE